MARVIGLVAVGVIAVVILVAASPFIVACWGVAQIEAGRNGGV